MGYPNSKQLRREKNEVCRYRPYPCLSKEESLGRGDGVHGRLFVFQILLKVAKKESKIFGKGVQRVKKGGLLSPLQSHTFLSTLLPATQKH